MNPQPIRLWLGLAGIDEQVQEEALPSTGKVPCLAGISEGDDINIARAIPIASCPRAVQYCRVTAELHFEVVTKQIQQLLLTTEFPRFGHANFANIRRLRLRMSCADARACTLRLRWIEHALELPIGVEEELVGDDRALAGERRTYGAYDAASLALDRAEGAYYRETGRWADDEPGSRILTHFGALDRADCEALAAWYETLGAIAITPA
jgi:hypothetical protein